MLDVWKCCLPDSPKEKALESSRGSANWYPQWPLLSSSRERVVRSQARKSREVSRTGLQGQAIQACDLNYHPHQESTFAPPASDSESLLPQSQVPAIHLQSPSPHPQNWGIISVPGPACPREVRAPTVGGHCHGYGQIMTSWGLRA